MTPISFYFDFLSPYGYFASKLVEPLAARHGREVCWHPMLLGVSVLKVMGLKPLLDTPLKGDYVRNDVLRTARKLGLPLGRDMAHPPTSSLVPARVLCWAKHGRPDVTSALAHALYDAIWRDGVDLNRPDDLRHVQLPQGMDPEAVVAAASSAEAADLLRGEVARSLELGIFGSPTVVVDGEPFWGADRLVDVEDWLASGGW